MIRPTIVLLSAALFANALFPLVTRAQFISNARSVLTQAEIDKLDAGETRDVLKFKLVQSRENFEKFYKNNFGQGNIDILGQFLGGMTKDDAVLVNEVLSGIGGRMRVSVSTAFSVADVDSMDLDEEITLDQAEERRAAITRLIANGGTVSIRAYHPLFASRGRASSHVLGYYFSGGLINSLEDTTSELESATGAFGATIEYLANIGVRQGVAGDSAFNIPFGVRFSLARTTKKFLDFDRRTFRLVQIVFGIKTESTINYMVTVNVLDEEFEDYAPRVLFTVGKSLK